MIAERDGNVKWKVDMLPQGLAGIHRVFIAPRAASVVANRFGDDLVIVRFNIRKSGDATIEALASS
jgi:hypothetical protein